MKRRPLKWLEEADPQEIGEALLAVDPIKAAEVVAYLGTRAAPEASGMLTKAARAFEDNPMRSLMKGIKAITD